MVLLDTMSFWHELPRPIMVLAPLANVTDVAFRRVIATHSRHKRKDGTYGGPDVFWTEFVSADGLMCAIPKGREILMEDLKYSEEERPIVAQLFSSHEEHMAKATQLCMELGFDGIDINMGCPDRAIEKQGCGAAMMKDPRRAREIIRAVKRGGTSAGKTIPVSVKTRIGYSKNEIDTWLPELLAEHPDAITIHARTRKEMSKVPARWEHIAHAVALRDVLQQDIPPHERTRILGNGDVVSLVDAENKVKETGADGVMFGRAIFGNPWFFNPKYHTLDISVHEKLSVMCEHTALFQTLLPHKNFALMKKHYKAYVHGFDGAKELRMELMETRDASEVRIVVNRFLDEYLNR